VQANRKYGRKVPEQGLVK